MKKLLALFLCTFLSIGVYGCSTNDTEKKEDNTKEESQSKLDWPEDGISTILPKPIGSSSEIGADFDDSFTANIYSEKADYKTYVNKCKKNGFTIETKEENDDFTGFNKDGYNLHIYYSDYSKYYSVNLDAPIEIGNLNWPTSGTSSLLPIPSSSKGNIKIDSSSRFLAYIGDTTIADFKKYTDSCRKKGFNVDYNSGDTYYNGDNTNGDSIHVKYEGFKIMSISLYPANDTEKEETTKTPNDEESNKKSNKEKETSSNTKKSSTKINDDDFKKAMDSYEDFMNEYVDFMKKYKDSDNAVEMLDDYTKYMKKYTDAMEKLDKIDTSELTDDQIQYYTEVTLRVADKLSKIQ